MEERRDPKVEIGGEDAGNEPGEGRRRGYVCVEENPWLSLRLWMRKEEEKGGGTSGRENHAYEIRWGSPRSEDTRRADEPGDASRAILRMTTNLFRKICTQI